MDTSRIVKSPFQFKTYKIDKTDLKVKPSLKTLLLENTPQDLWKLKMSIRTPLFYKERNFYVGGLDLTLIFTDEKETQNPAEENNFLVKLEVGIVGVFQVEEEIKETNVEDQIVRIQIPALLLPYLRSTTSNLLSNAGFGSFIFPLINIHAYADRYLKNVKIKIIE